jgi:hypothetical protein
LADRRRNYGREIYYRESGKVLLKLKIMNRNLPTHVTIIKIPVPRTIAKIDHFIRMQFSERGRV